MSTGLMRLASYTTLIRAPSPLVWSLWGWVMKMTPILRKLVPSLVRRRVTPSPASMTYWAPLTISRFDDCARPIVGAGPARVPSVIRRVPDFEAGGAPLDCPQLMPARAMTPIVIRLVVSNAHDLCMFPSGGQGRAVQRHHDTTP